MPFSMKLWQVQGKDLQEINRDILNDEQRLENWVVKDPSILGIDYLSNRETSNNRQSRSRRSVSHRHRGVNLVVLELKRDKTPREIVTQVLDYASWMNDLTFEQIETIAKGFTGKPLAEAFSEQYGSSLPQTVNGNHSMVILASELDDSSERIVQYLADRYEVPINVLFFTFFKTASGEFVGRAWLKDPEEMQERAQARNQCLGRVFTL
jgi:hypothetical protein